MFIRLGAVSFGGGMALIPIRDHHVVATVVTFVPPFFINVAAARSLDAFRSSRGACATGMITLW